MCTAITLQTKDFYFGRTLDLEYHYEESIVVTPRQFPLRFRRADSPGRHCAVIGVATVIDGYPLYYDAANEHGLCMAGLNFPGNAVYHPYREEKENIAPFELIPWILGSCRTAEEAVGRLAQVSLLDEAFRADMPLTPLHWMIADHSRCIVVEPMAGGLVIHDNPVGVLTNNPPFEHQLHDLNRYMQLSPYPPRNSFADGLELTVYSRGMGALGLPGDLSSQSRFVRAAFTRCNSICGSSEEESVSQFFHVLGSVEQTRGCVRLESGSVTTVYTSCCNADRGIYYYTTYDNRSITGVDMHREHLDSAKLAVYPLEYKGRVNIIN